MRATPEAELQIRQRTCQTCGMLLDDAGEFHPYVFCILKKAGRDPWGDITWVMETLGYGPFPERPPLIRSLQSDASSEES